jgi:5-methylcytosine-specific restriction enzyme B
MNLKELVSTIEVWDDWNKNYNYYVPKFIEEAKSKEHWEDWEEDIFHEFFEQAREQCVSSLQQGYFTNEEKVKIKRIGRRLVHY